MYCFHWGSACNPNKHYHWKRLIWTPAWNFLILAANLLSSRWLGSLRWILIAQGPEKILLPGQRSAMNTVIWSHISCSTALCSVPGLRSVCRQCWMFPVRETRVRRVASSSCCHVNSFFLHFIRVQWIIVLCQFLPYSIVTQSYICMHSFSYTMFHHVLSRETVSSSLGWTVGPHCLSILNARWIHTHTHMPIHFPASLSLSLTHTHTHTHTHTPTHTPFLLPIICPFKDAHYICLLGRERKPLTPL